MHYAWRVNRLLNIRLIGLSVGIRSNNRNQPMYSVSPEEFRLPFPSWRKPSNEGFLSQTIRRSSWKWFRAKRLVLLVQQGKRQQRLWLEEWQRMPMVIRL